jgi:hypothetical protein
MAPKALEAGVDALEAPADVSASTSGPPSSGTDLTLFSGLAPLYGLGMPPATTPFSAAAFLCGMPSTAADSALAAALATAKTMAAAAQERVCVAHLAREHERTTTNALARWVVETEHLLHAFEGEHVTSSQQVLPTTLPRLSAGP